MKREWQHIPSRLLEWNHVQPRGSSSSVVLGHVHPVWLAQRCHPGVRGTGKGPKGIGAVLIAYLLLPWNVIQPTSNQPNLPCSCGALVWVVLQYLTQRWSGAIIPLALQNPADARKHTQACLLTPAPTNMHVPAAVRTVGCMCLSMRLQIVAHTSNQIVLSPQKGSAAGAQASWLFAKGQSWLQITAVGRPGPVMDLGTLCVYPHTCTSRTGRQQHRQEHTAILQHLKELSFSISSVRWCH